MTAEEAAKPRDWIFTFGGGHRHPLTGASLAYAYVVIHGDWDSARQQMVRFFGQKWAMQYPTREDAGVARFRLQEIPLPEVH